MKNLKNIFNVITEIYIIFILILFPLTISRYGYEKILEIKYYSYLCITIIYLIINLFVYLYFLIIKKTNYFNNYKLKKYHIFMFIFLLINIISTIFSPYKDFNLIKGIGRGEGLLNIFLYIMMFFNISFFGEFKKRYILYFSISNILISCIGFFQFFDFDPLNLYKELSGPYNMSYISTIGNIDFVSAYYTIVIPVIALSFIFLNNQKKYDLINILSLIFGITVFLLIDVDSGKVAFLFTILIVLPNILKKNIFLSKFLILLSIIMFGYFIVYFTNMTFYYSNMIYKPMFNFNTISLFLIFVILIILLTAKYIYRKKYELKSIKKIQKYIFISYLIIGIFTITILYIYPFNNGILYQIHQMLHDNFDDTFGTYRIFLWKRSIKLIPEYLLLGTGPDTFALRFMSKYYLDVINLDGYLTINDSAANVYLTMLVNIGVIGLIIYLLSIGAIIVNSIMKNTKLDFIFIMAVVCFLIQDFFNLSVVIITPLFYLLLSVLTLEKN